MRETSRKLNAPSHRCPSTLQIFQTIEGRGGIHGYTPPQETDRRLRKPKTQPFRIPELTDARQPKSPLPHSMEIHNRRLLQIQSRIRPLYFSPRAKNYRYSFSDGARGSPLPLPAPRRHDAPQGPTQAAGAPKRSQAFLLLTRNPSL